MNHKQYMQTVKEYSQRSGHSINYYDGGYSATDTGSTKKRPVQKGSLAKDKMRDLLGKRVNADKRLNTTGVENDI